MPRQRVRLVGGAVLAFAALVLFAVWVVNPSLGRAGALRAAPAPASRGAAPSETPETGPLVPSRRVVRFAAVGDSITLANSPDFLGGRTGSLSWITYAVEPNLLFVGGWARGGATTALMASNVEPEKADVLAIIAGTNDLAQRVPFSQTTANLDRIVAIVGANRVVVSAVPPRNDNPQGTDAFNEALGQFVALRGWAFVDASAGVRNGSLYAPGMSDDGVHPSANGARIIGRALALALANSAG